MNKPNNPKCDTCYVTNNILRCFNCKYKTKEWERKNIRPNNDAGAKKTCISLKQKVRDKK